ncbi:MAG: DUF3892 domain-containing protein [Nanoarchaeota archaeon]
MAKYYIQRVRKDKDDNITRVQTMRSEFSTQEVVEMIEESKGFFVVQEGATEVEVKLYPREGKKFIRTWKDGEWKNNLDNLPTF